jgi:hypothetical protein
MRLAAGAALGLALAAAAVAAQPGDREGPPRRSYADPSAVIAADLALGREGREKGEIRALRRTAAPGAVLFAPREVDAATWLKRVAEPAATARWQPRTVWTSCDGGYAVSRGVWTRGAVTGEYLAVWVRQEKGAWKWLLREEAPAAAQGDAPEMIAGLVAECSGLPRRRPPVDSVAVPLDPAAATSLDHSLRWSVKVGPDCVRAISVEAWDGKALATVFAARRDPPKDGCGPN